MGLRNRDMVNTCILYIDTQKNKNHILKDLCALQSCKTYISHSHSHTEI